MTMQKLTVNVEIKSPHEVREARMALEAHFHRSRSIFQTLWESFVYTRLLEDTAGVTEVSAADLSDASDELKPIIYWFARKGWYAWLSSDGLLNIIEAADEPVPENPFPGAEAPDLLSPSELRLIREQHEKTQRQIDGLSLALVEALNSPGLQDVQPIFYFETVEASAFVVVKQAFASKGWDLQYLDDEQLFSLTETQASQA